MKWNVPWLWCVLACSALIAGGHYLSGAQVEDEADEAACDVAVLDVQKVFKEHKGFRKQLENMKRDVAAVEADIRVERDKIVELSKEMKALDGGELKKKLEEEVARRQADLQVKMSLKKKEFMEQEAIVYAKTYRQLQITVAEYSRKRGIRLVLRHNDLGKISEMSERQKVLAAVNNGVVFEDGIDITAEIIERLNGEKEGGDL